MKKIESYFLYYTPKGNGRVIFKLKGETGTIATDPLSATELAAVAAVLAQKNIEYDPVQKTFASYDDDKKLFKGYNLFT
jgi:hypothetical protein